MSMKLSIRQVGDVTVMDAAGRITLGEGTSSMRDAIRDAVAAGHRKVLLNLGEVNYIDSSGIGELVSAFTTVTDRGGQLKLLSLSTSRICSKLPSCTPCSKCTTMRPRPSAASPKHNRTSVTRTQLPTPVQSGVRQLRLLSRNPVDKKFAFILPIPINR